jgi:FHA domain
VVIPGLLVLWSGEGPRRDTHRIPSAGLVLGRDHASSSDERISRQHARIRVEGHYASVTDLGSRNGTFVGLDSLAEKNTRASWMPFVIRAGHTVGVVVRDVQPYEELALVADESDDPLRAATNREVHEAARAEENLTIEGPLDVTLPFARRYAELVGGQVLDFDPRVGVGLDHFLEGTRPRTVILRLVNHALELRDLPAIEMWLETDVRFVTLTRQGEKPLSMVRPKIVASLRRRVMEVLPPFESVPAKVIEIVRVEAPHTTIHPTLIELVLEAVRGGQEEDVLTRLRSGVRRWILRDELQTEDMLRGDDVRDDLFGSSGAVCVVGDLR